MKLALVTRLRGGLATGTGIDWGRSPQGAALPRVVLHQVGGGPVYEYGGGVTDTAEALVQVDCLALGVDAVEALALAVKALLSGWISRPDGIMACFVVAERDFETETAGVEDIARRIIDIRVHYKET